MPVSSHPEKLAEIRRRRAQRTAACEHEIARLQALLETKHRLRQELLHINGLQAQQAAAREELRRQLRDPAAYATAERTAKAEVEQLRRAITYNLDTRVMPLLELWQRDPDQGKPGPDHPPRVFANRGAQYG